MALLTEKEAGGQMAEDFAKVRQSFTIKPIVS